MKSRRYKAVFLFALIFSFFLIGNYIGRFNENSIQVLNEKKYNETEYKNEVSNKTQAGGKEDKVAYLTFDDGPSRNTKKVLNILDKYNAKATFFIIGEQITDKYKDIVKETVDRGHSIGIHTFCHDYKKIYTNCESYIHDFEKTCDILNQTIGYIPKIYRFPGGSCNVYIGCIKSDIMDELNGRGFKYYDWNVSGEDSVGRPSSDSIYKNVVKDVTNFNEPVILLHDSSLNSNTVNILPRIIEYIISKGYTLKPISE